jgi:hypothetical protein
MKTSFLFCRCNWLRIQAPLIAIAGAITVKQSEKRLREREGSKQLYRYVADGV